MENFALSNLVCFASVIGLDVMHNYISFPCISLFIQLYSVISNYGIMYI
jgi:hypothetical protein